MIMLIVLKLYGSKGNQGQQWGRASRHIISLWLLKSICAHCLIHCGALIQICTEIPPEENSYSNRVLNDIHELIVQLSH